MNILTNWGLGGEKEVRVKCFCLINTMPWHQPELKSASLHLECRSLAMHRDSMPPQCRLHWLVLITKTKNHLSFSLSLFSCLALFAWGINWPTLVQKILLKALRQYTRYSKHYHIADKIILLFPPFLWTGMFMLQNIGCSRAPFNKKTWIGRH